ncbi:polysaccharide deacetylase family protein [uncultured Algimonas sp.]|uniref:polysaccharide deacetylase family protein n=1 Tax=uncultured Algimonas sp. TaxID=1547920 RepID=UPI002609E48D|nr:polysaccharide deacetylase family protein [uncultured Algimonas sp.]
MNESAPGEAILPVSPVSHAAAFGIMAHHLHDDALPPTAQGSMSSDEFAVMLDYFGSRLLPAREWLERCRAGALRDEICITFDDALRGQYDVALPILEAKGLTALYFIYTGIYEIESSDEASVLETHRYFRNVHFKNVDDFYADFHTIVSRSSHADIVAARVERDFDPQTYLSAYQVYSSSDRLFRFVRDEVLGPEAYRGMVDDMIVTAGLEKGDIAEQVFLSEDHILTLHDRGHEIGLHSTTHPTRMENLSRDHQFTEYRRNSLSIERICGETPRTMSHPSNSYNASTLDVLVELDVDVGFRADCVQGGLSPMLELPRDNHTDLIHSID